MSEVEKQQAFLARFLAEPEFEARLRASPEDVALEGGVAPEYARRLARLAPERVLAFRRSRRHKDEVRAGRAPGRI